MAAHPTIANMLQNPYGVLSEYTDPDGHTYPGVYATIVNNLVPTFQGHFDLVLDKILIEAAANERAKEWMYIEDFLSSIEPLKDYNLYQDIVELCNQLRAPIEDKNRPLTSFSRIIDSIQKLQMNLYDITKSLEENEQTFKEFNKLAATEPISKSLREALKATGPLTKLEFGGIDKNTKGIDIINQAMEFYQNKINEAIEKNGFTSTQIKVLNQLVKVYTIKLQEFYENKLSSVISDPLYKNLNELEEAALSYDANKKSDKEKIMVTKKGIPKTIYQVVWDAINGSLGGKGIEYTIDLSHGGKNTGAVKNAKGQDIDADNIQLASGKLKFYFTESNDLFEKVLNNIRFDHLKEELKAINDIDRKFLIMTSAKDQSTNAKFVDFHAKSETVKIKGDATLKSRKPEIEKMYQAIGNVGHNPSDLVFSIANLAADFVTEGQEEQAKRTLGAICIAWMFDDAQEIVQGTQFIKGSNSLHFYNLNGKYYTLSDILELTAKDLSRKSLAEYTSSNSDSMKYVKIGITLPKSNPYEAMLKSTKQPAEGIDQWDYVANILNKSIKIGIDMSVQNLFNDLFGNLMGVKY